MTLKLDAWHILWTDPLNQVYRQQIGRARGDDIVQDGTDEAECAGALELHRDHAEFFSLVGRAIAGRWDDVSALG